MNLTITIDDNDRDQCPDQPWTATCAELCVSGVGATRADALRDLADAITVEED